MVEETCIFCHSLDPEVLLEDPVAEEDDLDPSRGRHGVGAVGQYLDDVHTKKARAKKRFIELSCKKADERMKVA